jgi:hypothetical protein
MMALALVFFLESTISLMIAQNPAVVLVVVVKVVDVESVSLMVWIILGISIVILKSVVWTGMMRLASVIRPVKNALVASANVFWILR